MDSRIQKLAELLVNYSVGVKPGQRVLINAPAIAAPLIQAVYVETLKAGAHPFTMTEIPELTELLYKNASREQLEYIHEPVRLITEQYDAFIYVIADTNTKSLTGIDPQKISLRRASQTELNKAFFQRAADGKLRWTLTLFPTHASAQDAEMSLSEFEDFVYNACMPDSSDPVGYWQKVAQKQTALVDWLKGKKSVHILAPETDLRLSIDGRNFISCACNENVPDGEIFTGPVEDSLEGQVHFSYPAIYTGHEVSGVHLAFEKGKIVRASADKNEAFLNQMLDTDPGARFVGEFAFGTNEAIQRFTRQILFDEKIGGSIHLAAGSGYPETGSKNESGIHWDMICDLRQGGEVWVDDELFYHNGKFVIPV
jgi:aminopeptidase